ncbi:protein containing DUF721 [gut metagenome]|uniref:Protein containing DUF721 n=1 Tax=gut metagenome TaxID=749906 RepID=J9GP32_9ZZZZ
MREAGLESPLNQYRLIAAWPEVAGETVSRYTGEIYIRNQTLYVQLKSPALKANLMMRRRELAQLLNQKIGAFVITDVVFV